MMDEVTAPQGSQPAFGRVSVGIMRAALKDGVPTARLAVRSPDHRQIVDLAVGERALVPGEGTVTLAGVRERTSPDAREMVDLRWDPLEHDG